MTNELTPPIDPRKEVSTFDNRMTLVGCSRAVVALAWIYNRTTKVSHQVWAQVELIADEWPRVDRSRDSAKRLGGDSEWTVYFESWEVQSSRAAAWYDSLVENGEWAPPWREPPLAAPVPVADRLDEPRWPALVLRTESPIVPAPARSGSSVRSHHLLTAHPVPPDLLAPSELQKLTRAVKEHFRVDLDGIPELLQSGHFFQPLPVLRRVSSRLDAPHGGPDKAVLIDIVPRKGMAIENLMLEVFEVRPSGSRLLSRVRPEVPFYRLPLGEDVAQILLRVFHDDLGLLLEEGPYAFLRGISLQMKLIGSERRVPLPARKGREATVRRIPMGEEDRPVVVGRESPMSASRVFLGIKHRLTTRSGARDRQRWFRGEVEAAERAVQEILSSAKQRAMVVDPYFAADDVKVWLPAVTNRGVEIQVLTSSAGLRHRTIQGVALKGRELEREHLSRLSAELTTAEDARLVNPTAVRVMRGKLPPIHDRFIVADDRVWLLGASLNEFGTRGTMLVALPSPGEVLLELEKVRDTAESVTLAERLIQLKAPAQEGEE